MQSHRQRQRPYQDYRTDNGNAHKTVFGVHRRLSYVFGVSQIESHRSHVNKLSRIEHSNRTRQPPCPLATAPTSRHRILRFRHLAAGSQLVDGLGQGAGEFRQQVFGAHADFRCELRYGIGTERLV